MVGQDVSQAVEDGDGSEVYQRSTVNPGILGKLRSSLVATGCPSASAVAAIWRSCSKIFTFRDLKSAYNLAWTRAIATSKATTGMEASTPSTKISLACRLSVGRFGQATPASTSRR
jgi:hypothetical protein